MDARSYIWISKIVYFELNWINIEENRWINVNWQESGLIAIQLINIVKGFSIICRCSLIVKKEEFVNEITRLINIESTRYT